MNMFVEGCVLPCDYCHQHVSELGVVVVSPEAGPVQSYWICNNCAMEAHL